MNRKIGLAELQFAQRRIPDQPERLLTLAECAVRTGLKVSTWRAWILHRRFPFHKIGRSIRILEADLNQMIEQARIPAREARDGR